MSRGRVSTYGEPSNVIITNNYSRRRNLQPRGCRATSCARRSDRTFRFFAESTSPPQASRNRVGVSGRTPTDLFFGKKVWPERISGPKLLSGDFLSQHVGKMRVY